MREIGPRSAEGCGCAGADTMAARKAGRANARLEAARPISFR
jgi:hypothetical protein